mmetsp:Transcript_27763/g.64146  ORF Transcript_27763/g.64146 Transcript_27763/m.64146 type:complete len:313 (+) Transcript_27763:67-1005(+)
MVTLQLLLYALSCSQAVALALNRAHPASELQGGVADDFAYQLWDGRDDTAEETGCQDIANSSAQQYVTLGPMDSGTNLLKDLLRVNFPDQICLLRDMVWKHGNSGVDDIYSQLHKKIGPNLSGVVLLHTHRAPLAQVVSWVKAPYELQSCVRDGMDDMLKPCSATVSPLDGFPNPNTLVDFSSIMDVYNKYMEQYEMLDARGGFKATVSVGYEDMVLTPDKVLQEILDVFDPVAMPDELQTISGPSKTHGHAIGREAALLKLENRSYLTELSVGMHSKLCGLLNTTLLDGVVEGKFLPAEKQAPYTADCESV